MPQPGRTWDSSANYRYGFNGMETDSEVKQGAGKHYTTYFRQYDPRLGRWWSNDPVVQLGESPYAAMFNNPIGFSDPLGNNPPEGDNPLDPRPQSPINSSGVPESSRTDGARGPSWTKDIYYELYNIERDRLFVAATADQNIGPQIQSASQTGTLVGFHTYQDGDGIWQFVYEVTGNSYNMPIGVPIFSSAEAGKDDSPIYSGDVIITTHFFWDKGAERWRFKDVQFDPLVKERAIAFGEGFATPVVQSLTLLTAPDQWDESAMQTGTFLYHWTLGSLFTPEESGTYQQATVNAVSDRLDNPVDSYRFGGEIIGTAATAWATKRLAAGPSASTTPLGSMAIAGNGWVWNGNLNLGRLQISLMSQVKASGMSGYRLVGFKYKKFTGAIDYHNWPSRVSGSEHAPISQRFLHYHWGRGKTGKHHMQFGTGSKILDASQLRQGIFNIWW